MPQLDALDRVNAYANDVVTGRVPACQWVRLACQRHLDDLNNGQARGIWFDRAAADRAFAFFEKYLCHSKGEWARKLFVLQPWNCFIIGSLFGWKRADGLRRFRQAYIEVPRKNGKSTLSAGIALYMTIADGEEGSEVYSAATKRDQAMIVWGEAKRMVQASPALSTRMRIFASNMNAPHLGAKFEPLGADSKNLDGLNVHCAVVDELHAHRSRDMLDVLDTATGARREPLIVCITTAGKTKLGVCWDEHDYVERLLKGLLKDDAQFGIIYTIDDGDDWQSPEAWAKANPNFDVSVKPDDLAYKIAKAAHQPAKQRAFKRLHLNMWVEGDSSWIDLDAWDACGQQPIDVEALKGRECYGGLDLSSTTDITALALVFPPRDDEEPWVVLVYFWVPAENMERRISTDQVPYDLWKDQGYITATEGNIIDYGAVRNKALWAAETFDLRELAYDRFNATHLVTELMDEGLTMVPFGQGFVSMAAPMRELGGLVIGTRLAHGGNPVLRWMAGNLVASQDDAGNLKPSKAKSKEKIDGMAALLTGMGRALAVRSGNDNAPIVYRKGDMIGAA